MPKQRQRIVFCDCLDCAESEAPRATDVPTALSPAGEAAARQDPPPKCLLVVLSGALQPAAPGGGGGAVGGGESAAASTAAAAGEGGTVLDSLRLPHLDRAARAGCQGLLVVREGSAAEPGPEASLPELAQLLGVYEEWKAGAAALPSLQDRFKGMAVSLLSNQPAAVALALAAGAGPSRLLSEAAGGGGGGEGGRGGGGEGDVGGGGGFAGGFSNAADSSGNGGGGGGGLGLPTPEEAARAVLAELGLQAADAGLDLVILHIDAHTAAAGGTNSQTDAGGTHAGASPGPGGGGGGAGAPSSSSPSAAAAAAAARGVAEWSDRVLRYLNNSAPLREAVLVGLVLTPAGADLGPGLLRPGGGEPLEAGRAVGDAAAADSAGGSSDVLEVPRPPQSWEDLGGRPFAGDARRPLLCARRLAGVMRVDGCGRLGLGECLARGGMGAIVVDRLLPEIAYKVGRAPKYGA